MTTSENINELAAALAKAQALAQTATKDATNPHFGSTYATLQSVREAIAPFHGCGLSLVQGCHTAWIEGVLHAAVESRLIHASGQWIADTLAIPVSKPDAQGVASAMTYARRVGGAGLTGIAPADDEDANAAVGRAPVAHTKPALVKPEGLDDWLDDLRATADTGLEALEAAWKASPQVCRDFLRADQPKTIDALKARAKAVQV